MSEVSFKPEAKIHALPAPFACSWKRDGFGSAWLHLRGELDLATSPSFRRALREAQSSARTVSIDLQELDFIDCSALKVILDADALARRTGDRLTLIRGSGQVDRVLTLTCLSERVEVVEAAGGSELLSSPEAPGAG